MTVFLNNSQYDVSKGAEIMRLYGIYKVKMKYEQFIIGREHLLYELLKGNINYKNRMQEVHYLCEQIEEEMIEHVILSRFNTAFESVTFKDGAYELTHSIKGKILISFTPYSLIVKCIGSRMLDLDLFVGLSEIDRRFFAVMEGRNEWGWLKPVKHTSKKEKSATVFH